MQATAWDVSLSLHVACNVFALTQPTIEIVCYCLACMYYSFHARVIVQTLLPVLNTRSALPSPCPLSLAAAVGFALDSHAMYC